VDCPGLIRCEGLGKAGDPNVPNGDSWSGNFETKGWIFVQDGGAGRKAQIAAAKLLAESGIGPALDGGPTRNPRAQTEVLYRTDADLPFARSVASKLGAPDPKPYPESAHPVVVVVGGS
jgi:hypothetical protein